jgi:hypothetical protein
MYRRLFYGVNILALFAAVLIGFGTQVQAQATTNFSGARIYFTESNNEPSRFDRDATGVSRFAGLLENMGAQLLTLDWRNGVPEDADLVIIPGPGLRGNLSAAQVADLWLYMSKGGRLLLLSDPVVHQTRDMISNIGLFELTWLRYGLRGRDDWLVTPGEMQTIQIPEVPEDVAEGVDPENPEEVKLVTVEVPVLITDFTTTNVSADHPITAGIQGELAFFGARSLEIDVMVGASERTPLIFSNPDFYGETDYFQYLETGYSDYLVDVDVAPGNEPLAVAFSDSITNARMVLIGDRDFAVNGRGLATSPAYSDSFVYPANAQFLIQAVAWLLDAEAPAVSFPTPAPTETAAPEPTEAEMAVLEATEEASN